MTTSNIREQAIGLMRQGRAHDALSLLDNHLSGTSAQPEDHELAARIALAIQDPAAAARYARIVLQTATGTLPLMAAQHLAQTGAIRDASRAADRFGDADAADPRHLDALAQLLTLCERHAEAEPVYRRLAELAPHLPQARFNWGACLRYLGRLDEAETAFDQVVREAPGHFEAIYARSTLKRQSADANHVDELRALLDRNDLPAPGRVQIGYALGKELEDLEDWPYAFAAYASAASAMKNLMRYRVEPEIAQLDAIAATQTAEALPQADGSASGPAPVFVLGLPRTGSTLVERMLSGHAAIRSAGELDALAASIVRATPHPGPDMARATLQAGRAQIATAYREALAQRGFEDGVVIDKMPLNFLYCGLINAAVPGARIIHVHRDPRDALLATYKTLFRDRYGWSYSLADAARYIAAYRRLMAHWHRQYPGSILDVAYEDVVADPGAAARRALDFLGLDWDPACLDFAARRDAVTTASASQVREGVHDRSVGKWRKFADFLEPHFAQLET